VAPAAPGAGATLSAGRRAQADGETSARTWVRRYAEALRSLLDRAEEPVPGADAPLRVGEGRVLLSGDLPRNAPPAVLLDGGTLLVSPSRSALRDIVSRCARFLETAPGDAPLPAFLPALSRETVSAPLLVGAAGGGVDALDTALGIDFPASLPRAARSREWRDEADCDLLFTGPVRPADGLGTAVLRIGGRTPAVTFTALPADGSVRLVRLPGAGG